MAEANNAASPVAFTFELGLGVPAVAVGETGGVEECFASMFCEECGNAIDGEPLAFAGKPFCSDGCRDEWQDTEQDAAIMSQEASRFFLDADFDA